MRRVQEKLLRTVKKVKSVNGVKIPFRVEMTSWMRIVQERLLAKAMNRKSVNGMKIHLSIDKLHVPNNVIRKDFAKLETLYWPCCNKDKNQVFLSLWKSIRILLQNIENVV